MSQTQLFPPRAPFIDERERSALINWIFVWVLLANACFSLMYFIGSPPRLSGILAFGALGLVVRSQPFPVQCAAFIAAMAYAIIAFISGLFNLSLFSLSHSVVFLSELRITDSVEYLAAIALLSAFLIAACLMLRKRSDFKTDRAMLIAALMIVGFVMFDSYMGQGMRSYYMRLADANASFTSATAKAQIVPHAEPLKRNLVIVMVESLGVPVNNAEMQRLLFARYKGDDISSRFDVTSGTTSYYGSTTAGEIRELCGRWGDYHDLVRRFDGDCLPARLTEEGIETSSYHSFDGAFFDRTEWYPNIGFANRYFRDDIVEQGARHCGGVFAGACDRDVPRQIAQRLKDGGEPQFIYWLTVNSHLPVPIGSNLEVDHCQRLSRPLAKDFPMICRQFAIWDSIDAALVQELTAPDFPPTDVLIVGDHMPPYLDRGTRKQFAPDAVPWLLLKWRETVS